MIIKIVKVSWAVRKSLLERTVKQMSIGEWSLKATSSVWTAQNSSTGFENKVW